jgi:hypothetical protein
VLTVNRLENVTSVICFGRTRRIRTADLYHVKVAL